MNYDVTGLELVQKLWLDLNIYNFPRNNFINYYKGYNLDFSFVMMVSTNSITTKNIVVYLLISLLETKNM